MKLCPGCQREVADDAKSCECGLSFDEIAAEPAPDSAQQASASQDARPQSVRSNHQVAQTDTEADIEAGDLEAEGADEVDMDEADLDSEEIDLVEADLDMDSTEELVAAQEEPLPEVPYSRRENLAPKKAGPTIVIIAAHAVIIIAAICIFYYKNMRDAGSSSDYPPDYTAPSDDYVTLPNTPARMLEDAIRRADLSSRPFQIEWDSFASPEVNVVVRLKGAYRSVEQLRQAVEADAVLIWQAVMKSEGRITVVHVTVQACFSGAGNWENALVVTFERGKPLPKGNQHAHDILVAFGPTYHPLLRRQ